jgi:hypothetical protein
VLTWDSPHSRVSEWQDDGNWQFDPGLPTELDLDVVVEGPDRTRIDREHRNLERLGDAQARIRTASGSHGGWQGLSDVFAQAAAGWCVGCT